MSARNERHHRNRLSGEASPYLLQHAENPVGWYPWGEEAFERARREDRPVLLSIGYATCHWCHVMARESFEDEATASLMNRHFVCVKVDREERPDVDELYMQATLAMNGHGGWPMTVFLTPEGKPFFAGTYFPPEPRAGMPSFRQVLEHVAARWASDRETLLTGAAQLTEVLVASASLPLPASIGREALRDFVADLERSYDASHGGFGGAPKFPPHAVLRLLLRLGAAGDGAARKMALETLDAMARGGIRDHLEGGFSRYATDAAWIVPHFEKMLYDNAQLARLYLEAFQLTHREGHRAVAVETLEFLLREMREGTGAFVSAFDADTEGEEGAYYVFTYEEILAAAGEDGELVARAFGASPGGNFEGKNVLHRPEPLGALAEERGVELLALREAMGRARRGLLALRERRERPMVDDKVIAAWNGLAVSALALGFEALGERRYLEAAEAAADAVFERLFDGARLLRTYRGEVTGRVEGSLEDYAFMGEAALDLFEATGEARHLERARALTTRIRSAFRDERQGVLRSTSRDAEVLVAQRTDASDGALPSAQGAAARLMLRLSHHEGDRALEGEVERSLRAHGRVVARAPRAYATLLEVAHALLEGPIELVVSGEPESPVEQSLRSIFVPHRVLLRVRPGDPSRPLSEGRIPAEGDPAHLYVCHLGTCGAPVTDPREAEAAIRAARRDTARTRLRRPPLSGAATRSATAAFLEARGVNEGAILGAGRGAPAVARLAPNLARVPDVEEMVAIVERSVARGLNDLDLVGMIHRDALEAVGESIARVTARGLAPREALVVTVGLGRFLVEDLRGIEAGVVPIDEAEARCLHPSAIERGLERAREALGLERIDSVILELESPDVDRETLAAAFAVLEAERAAGAIGRYGVSVESLEGDVAAWAMRTIEAAEEAGGADRALSMLGLPVNLAQGLDELASIDRIARGGSLTLFSSSPLEARGVRLVDPIRSGGARGQTRQTLAALRAAEEDFERDLGGVLRMPDGSALGRFFDLAPLLETIERELDDPSAYAAIEATAISRPVEERLGALDRACGQKLRDPWLRFRSSYVAALDAHLGALRAEMGARQSARVEPLLEALDPFLPMSVVSQPLSTKALHLLLAHPVLDRSAVPVERADEVDALREILELPALSDVAGAIEALISARRPSP